MKWLICLIAVMVATAAYGAFTLPQSNSSPNPSYTRTKSLGTKGFGCVSTVNRDAVRCKTHTATGTGTTSKWYFNGDNSIVYPTAEDTITTEKHKINNVCFGAYSAESPLTATCWGW